MRVTAHQFFGICIPCRKSAIAKSDGHELLSIYCHYVKYNNADAKVGKNYSFANGDRDDDRVSRDLQGVWPLADLTIQQQRKLITSFVL